MEIKFYTLTEILKKNAQYNIIIGERSNGKSYATLLHCLKQYVLDGSQFAIIRRWKEDIRGKRAQAIFSGIESNGEIEKITNGNYNAIYYINGKFYLCKTDESLKKPVCDATPCAFGFSLTDTQTSITRSRSSDQNVCSRMRRCLSPASSSSEQSPIIFPILIIG